MKKKRKKPNICVFEKVLNSTFGLLYTQSNQTLKTSTLLFFFVCLIKTQNWSWILQQKRNKNVEIKLKQKGEFQLRSAHTSPKKQEKGHHCILGFPAAETRQVLAGKFPPPPRRQSRQSSPLCLFQKEIFVFEE